MSDRSVRKTCIAKGINRSLDRRCTDDDPCPSCLMQKDVQENKELYEALEG